MAGSYIGKYDTTAANNTATGTGSVSIAEGMLPSNVNNAMRDIMADIRQWYNSAEWIEYGDGAGSYTPAYASGTSFTIAGADVTSAYHVGRRVKAVGSSTGTIYGSITATAFSTNTTVTVSWDSGSLSSESLTIYIGITSATNTSMPETPSITGDYTLDVSGDIILDADGGDVFFKDGGTTFGSATNTSGNLIIKSGTTTAATFSGANVTFAGTVGSGAITSTGIVTGTGFTAGSAVLAEAELELLDGLTAGTAIASKVVTTDSNIDTTGQRNLTISGELDAATLDISGNADIDGTTNLDAVDIDGAVQIDSTITVGVNDTGHDVKFFGATSGAYMLWDESTDDLVLAGAAKLYLYDAGGGEYISSSGSALTIASGGAALEFPAADGSSGQVLKTDGSGNLDWVTVSGTITALNNQTANRVTTIGSTTTELDGEANLTFDGTTLTATALTVDDVAVDGKVVTMTGSASDTAVLTAGTNGTLSIVTTDAAAAAANIQITADGTVDIDSAGVLTLDSGAAINIEPASGSAILLDGTISIDAGVVTGATSITSTAFVGNVTGNASGTAATVTTAAQSNITSLGTLTTLTVDNVIVNGTTIGHTSDTDLLTLTDGVLTVAGEVSATTLDIGGTNIGSTAAELNLLDGSAKSTSSITVADADALIVIDGTTTKQIPASDMKTYIGGGTSWQAVKTGNFTASAGQGVFVNTTSGAITITLPAGTIGDEVSIIDYAGTADSNNITVAANGSEKIHGSTDDLTVATERAAFKLVFTDSTQGWLLTDK